ncbi:ead/Ea22-like family protein [Citrobacter freundii]|uniref:ead/Ea22-like family protein n=1 Tax=Citrobacter freundii TaxID=546 RepID=UPI0015FAE0F3|nr:ead/Ea22-like family protein [Citrobacter freundii]MBA7998311.1 ead/Ea22-like family protein [Citrobacter freundii]MBJ8966722.1 ead/Ea22-like family protein [Citrobacter freundii]
MTNKQALREAAESTIGILENIAGFEPSDIDGDTVELRFETDGGLDTGCDVSIVDQCQKAADVVRALLDELEAKDRLNAELNSIMERWAVDRAQSASDLEAAEKRIAELEAREVILPPTFWYEHDDLSSDIPVLDKRLVKKAILAAGIGVKGGVR